MPVQIVHAANAQFANVVEIFELGPVVLGPTGGAVVPRGLLMVRGKEK